MLNSVICCRYLWPDRWVYLHGLIRKWDSNGDLVFLETLGSGTVRSCTLRSMQCCCWVPIGIPGWSRRAE